MRLRDNPNQIFDLSKIDPVYKGAGVWVVDDEGDQCLMHIPRKVIDDRPNWERGEDYATICSRHVEEVFVACSKALARNEGPDENTTRSAIGYRSVLVKEEDFQ